MRLQSRGLGRKELVMDFREYEATRDGDELLIQGTIREPVHWDFSIRMCEDDLAGLARVATRRATVGLLLRALFRRKKRHHWNGDRDEHVAKAKEAGKALTAKLREEQAAKKAAEAEAAREQAAKAATNGHGPADVASDATELGEPEEAVET